MSKISIKTPAFISLAFLSFLSFLASDLPAQVVLKNEQGKRIIVFPDGSWQYYEPDSTFSTGKSNRERFFFDNDILDKHRSQAEEAKKYSKSLALELIQARITSMNTEEDLTKLRKESNPENQKLLTEKEEELPRVIQREKALTLEYERAKEWVGFLEKIIFIPPALRDREIAEMTKKIGLPEQLAFILPNQEKSTPEFSSGSSFRFYKPFTAEDDVMIHPPPPPCKLAFTGKDKSTGGDRRDVEPDILFTYTDRGLEGVFSKRDLITCIGYLTSVQGGLRFLNLEIVIAAGKSPQLFGHLEKGSFAEIKLLNGENVRLIYNRSDAGVWNPALQAFIYKCQFPLGAREEKLLRSSELDSIVIRWSKVMEEYEIYDLDFIKRQFDCLDSL